MQRPFISRNYQTETGIGSVWLDSFGRFGRFNSFGGFGRFDRFGGFGSFGSAKVRFGRSLVKVKWIQKYTGLITLGHNFKECLICQILMEFLSFELLKMNFISSIVNINIVAVAIVVHCIYEVTLYTFT